MRTSGVLMPIFSLPSPYGIGTMGKAARKFVDFLVKGGQNTGRFFQSVRQVMEILHISLFPVLREIHILLIWNIYAKINF